MVSGAATTQQQDAHDPNKLTCQENYRGLLMDAKLPNLVYICLKHVIRALHRCVFNGVRINVCC
jgi:hypothetical protein